MLVCRKQNGHLRDKTPDRSIDAACGGGPVFFPRRRLSAFAEQLLDVPPGGEVRYQEEPVAVGDAA